MGDGIAEIGQDTVAQVFGQEPVEPRDHIGDAAVIDSDYLPQLFGIEALGQHRRVDEVGEHHCQLSTLGNARYSDGWDGCEQCFRYWWSIGQRGNGIEQPAAVPDRRNSELTQILARESVENLPINVMVTERGRVLFEPKAAQPFGHIHRSCPETASLGSITTPVHPYV